MNPQHIPPEMQAYHQWVCWRFEDRGEGKPTKVPYTPTTHKLASVTRPETWCTFKEACAALPRFDGIGFVLSKQDPYTIVDLDKTTDKSQIAQQIFVQQTLDSYSEVSPSGAGLHIVIKARLDRGRRRGPFELYSDNRFMTMTGNVYHAKPIEFAQVKLDIVMESLGLNNETIIASTVDEPQKYDDLAIYNTAAGASNGDKFQALWNGDFETYHYGDQSRADFAMIDILAFYTKNRDQIKRLFRQSGLGQRKKAQREDYVNSMVNRSFDNVVPDVDFTNLQPNVRIHEPKPLITVEKPAQTYKKAGALSMPPGLTGEIAKFIFSRSFKPVPEMAITAALGYMAGLSGRAFNVSNTGLNLYLLLLARTGRGKEEMAKGVSAINAALQQTCPMIADFAGPGDLASGQALLRYMGDHNTNSFLSIFGEFGLKLKSITRNNALSSDLMLLKVLLDLYNKSGANDIVQPTAYSDSERNTAAIHSPAFTMIGESVPDWFYENVDDSMIMSGMLPRFCVVEYLGKRPPSNHDGKYVVPQQDMLNKISTLVSVAQGLLQGQQRCNVELDPEATRMSLELDARGDDEINSTDSGLSVELWNRVHLKTLRVAALLAVGKNAYNPIIDVECFTWAENFIIHGVESLKSKFDTGSIGSNTEQQQVNELIGLLKGYVGRRPNTPSITDKMYESYSLPVSFITQRLRRKRVFSTDKRGATAAIDKTIKILIDSGDLTMLPAMQSQSLFGKNGKFYAITGDLDY